MLSRLLYLLPLLLLLPSPSTPSPHRAHIPRPARPHSPIPARSNSAPASLQIQQACTATRYPDTCQAVLSQSTLPPNPTPTDLILASLSASSSNLPTAISNAQSLLASSSNPNLTNAARNCLELLSLSSHRLARSSLALPASPPDAHVWTSAALLYQYDCFSALKYVNTSSQVDDAMRFLISLSNLTSNALSLLFSLRRFGDVTSLWRPPQTERDGYWPDHPSSISISASAPSLPPSLTPDSLVCQDSSPGCFPTVQQAVDAAPAFAPHRFVIRIKSGVYAETVRVPFNKTNLVFLGDGIGKTVITGSLNVQMPGVSTYNTATVAVMGDGFAARDITFENTAGPDAHQAVAFRCDGDLSLFENVEFLGHQDTLYCHSLRQYYRSCRIAGTVDFVFGNSAALFVDSELIVRPRQLEPEKGETNAVTAQGRTDPAQATGFVFWNCSVNGTEEYVAMYRAKPAVHKTFLGRPWKEYSRTVFLGCNLGEIVRAEGWLPWSGDFALATLFYGEFENYGPGGGDVSGRVRWSNQVPAEHVGVYSVENFIQGDKWVPN